MVKGMTPELRCKYCRSDSVIKYGKYKGTQYYYCKACRHKFASTETIPKMQYATSKIADAINMFYEGMSLKEIRRNFIQQHNDYISDVTAFNWVRRFTELAVNEASKYRPNVGDIWVAGETEIEIDGENAWLWDIMDTKTRFLIATHMSRTRTKEDAQILLEKAYNRTGIVPRTIYTTKLRAYLEGIEMTFGSGTRLKRGGSFELANNTNMIKRMQGTIKSRIKVMRGLHTIRSARQYMAGWLVHYNFFRPHMSLKDKTPAQAAGIKFPFKSWKEIAEAPYEKTARIKLAVTNEH
jgi:putative transposase